MVYAAVWFICGLLSAIWFFWPLADLAEEMAFMFMAGVVVILGPVFLVVMAIATILDLVCRWRTN